MVDSPSPIDGAVMATTPRKPISSPTAWMRPGNARTTTAATSAVNSGAPALIIAARDDSIHCCATANSTNGMAIQITPSRAIGFHSERGTARRAAGSMTRVSAPKNTRAKATTGGAKCSSPISMNRNEAPQSEATTATSPQSAGVKAWPFVRRDRRGPLLGLCGRGHRHEARTRR